MNSTSLIKGFRGKKLYSQEKVAELLGISRQSYNALENDLLHNDFTLVFKLLHVLDLSAIDIDEFFNALKQDYMSYQIKSE
ncbi:MAG: helix-turn-helix domain-containing protein [Bacilli bacterium]|nr:helix-turn-helix domain-containing protein [Bacilli bacterium]